MGAPGSPPPPAHRKNVEHLLNLRCLVAMGRKGHLFGLVDFKGEPLPNKRTKGTTGQLWKRTCGATGVRAWISQHKICEPPNMGLSQKCRHPFRMVVKGNRKANQIDPRNRSAQTRPNMWKIQGALTETRHPLTPHVLSTHKKPPTIRGTGGGVRD